MALKCRPRLQHLTRQLFLLLGMRQRKESWSWLPLAELVKFTKVVDCSAFSLTVSYGCVFLALVAYTSVVVAIATTTQQASTGVFHCCDEIHGRLHDERQKTGGYCVLHSEGLCLCMSSVCACCLCDYLSTCNDCPSILLLTYLLPP